MTARHLTPLALALYTTLAGPLAHAEDELAPLLQRAEYWQAHHRPDLAKEALIRALNIQPGSADVLYRLGLLTLPTDQQATQDWLRQLRQAHPSSVQVVRLEQAIRTQNINPQQLEHARQQARAGQSQAALNTYRKLFGGPTPLPAFASEYYQTLAGQERTWSEARRGLQQLLSQTPDDPQLQLALARVQSYREASRREAIEQLAKLAQTHPEAQSDWRNALLWLNASSADAARYQRYAQTYPNDTAVLEHYQKALQGKGSPAQTPGDLQRLAGYRALQQNHLSTALAHFNRALRYNAKDAEAWAGLGIVQLRQQNFAAAHHNLSQASELAPQRRAQWQEALANAEFYERLQQAQHLRDAGDLEAAESLATRLAADSSERSRNGKLLLGELQQRQ